MRKGSKERWSLLPFSCKTEAGGELVLGYIIDTKYKCNINMDKSAIIA